MLTNNKLLVLPLLQMCVLSFLGGIFCCSCYLSQDSVSSRGDDDDDCGSVTSERSAFSISSEMSISPYACAKFPNPVTVSV